MSKEIKPYGVQEAIFERRSFDEYIKTQRHSIDQMRSNIIIPEIIEGEQYQAILLNSNPGEGIVHKYRIYPHQTTNISKDKDFMDEIRYDEGHIIKITIKELMLVNLSHKIDKSTFIESKVRLKALEWGLM